MAEMNASVLVNMEGNLERRAQRYQRALGQFSRQSSRDLGRLRRVTGALGSGIDRLGNRYSALLTGAGAGLAARNVIRLEERFTRLGIAAGASEERMAKLKDRIFEVSQAADVRVDPAQLTAAVEQIVEETGDLPFAERNLRGLAVALQATAAAGKDIGGVGAQLAKNDLGNFLEIMDILATQGKQGAFTAQNFARMGPRLFSAMFAARPATEATARDLGATMQWIRQGTGNAEQATTAFEALLRTLQDADKIKMLQAGGIQVFDPDALKQGREELRPIHELMKDVIRQTGGRTSLISQVFDAEAMRAFNAPLAEFKRTGGLESVERFYNVQANGQTLLKDSARAAEDAAASLRNLATAAERFADTEMAGSIKEMADALNSLDPDQLQQLFSVLKWGAVVLGGLYAARKVTQGAGAIKDMLGKAAGGKGGGAGGILEGLGDMKPIPVYVVNKGFGGKGTGRPGAGGVGTGRAGRTGRILRPSTGRLVRAAPNMRTIGTMGAGAMGTAGLYLGAAGLAGYGVGTGIDYGLQQFEGGRSFRHGLGREIAKVMAIFGSDSAREALDTELRNRNRSQVDLRVTIDQEGNARTELSSDSRDVNLDVDAPLTMGIMP